MWRVLLGLFILFGNGSATLFFFNRYEPKKTLSYTEVAVYGFSLGYAVLTIIGVALAQIGLLTSPFTWLVIIALPILAICVWIYEKQKRKSVNPDQFIHEERQISEHRFAIHSTDIHISIRFSHLILFLIYAVGIILRLETQLTTEWLGDQDPYYHLAFIDSIVAQGTLPSRTYWGFYSYPPSFHVVFATLISTTHVDRYLLMKVVPEFLGFLCIPAVYVLIKKQYGEWAGITSAAFLAICLLVSHLSYEYRHTRANCFVRYSDVLSYHDCPYRCSAISCGGIVCFNGIFNKCDRDIILSPKESGTPLLDM
jgi:MFS family permease